MKIKAHKVFACLLGLMLFSSCRNDGKSDHKGNDGISFSIRVQIPTEEEAIQHIQTHVARTNKTVMVQSHYYENVQRKRRCDQIDRDKGMCSGADSGAPYGYKMVTLKERTCCRPEEILVSKIRGNWVATYSKPKDEWSVALEYKDDSKEEKRFFWSITLSKSNGLQVSFE